MQLSFSKKKGKKIWHISMVGFWQNLYYQLQICFNNDLNRVNLIFSLVFYYCRGIWNHLPPADILCILFNRSSTIHHHFTSIATSNLSLFSGRMKFWIFLEVVSQLTFEYMFIKKTKLERKIFFFSVSSAPKKFNLNLKLSMLLFKTENILHVYRQRYLLANIYSTFRAVSAEKFVLVRL